ncbi:CynX/NimT family MFS transporter [Roseomonas sp. CCTCC AB2023176]|uniref:MFS transporter n=1 Tax=Roseomonas sp. CCTCC AB2023176 TaxID=3342640 RepID=UPI0035DF1698
MAAALQVGKVAPVLLPVAAEFGVGLAGAAGLMSVFAAFAAVLGLLAGSVAARAGLHHALLGGLGAMTAAGLVAAVAPGIGLLYAARFVEGAGFLAVSVTAPALVAQRAVGRDRGLAMAAWSTFMPTGTALGLAMAPVVEGFGWRTAWGVAAMLPMVAGVAVASLVARDAAPRAPGRVAVPLRALIRARLPLRVALCFAAYTVLWVGLIGFLPSRLVQVGGLSLSLAGFAGAAASAANIVGNLSAGWAMRRGHAPGGLATAAVVVLTACSMAAFLLPAWWSASAALVACGVGGMVPASLFAMVPRSVPDAALTAPALGLVVQCNNIGNTLGPLLIAFAAGFGWAAVTAPLLLAGAAFLLCVPPLRRLAG